MQSLEIDLFAIIRTRVDTPLQAGNIQVFTHAVTLVQDANSLQLHLNVSWSLFDNTRGEPLEYLLAIGSAPYKDDIYQFGSLRLLKNWPE